MIDPQKTHALLIGIDDYGSSPSEQGGGNDRRVDYPKLRGCVADARAMAELLVVDLEVPEEQIFLLTAPRAQEPDCSDRPTYERLVTELKALGDRARPGDSVWIHYSGHGARVPTHTPGLKGFGAFDEAWVPVEPVDASEFHGRYLLDLELGFLIEQMVRRGLFVTLVMDCCHAGGMLRQAPSLVGARPRSHRVSARASIGPSSVASAAELAGSRRRFGAAGGRSKGYVMLAACREQEQAWEYPTDAKNPFKMQGALSRLLIDNVRRSGPDLSYRQLFERLHAGLHTLLDGFQTPRLEGEGHRRLLGGEPAAGPRGFTVLSVDEEKVLLATGACHDAKEGDRFALFPLIEDPKRSSAPPAAVEVAEVRGSESVATWHRRGETLYQPGDRAIPIPRGRCRVLIGPEFAELEGQLQTLDNPFFSWKRSPSADLRLRGIDGCLTVESAGSVPLPHPVPSVPRRDLQGLVRLLERLSRYRAFERLTHHGRSGTAVALEVRLGRLPDDFQPRRDEVRPLDELPPDSNMPFGCWWALTVENTCRQPLEIAVLNLDPTWCISQLYPSRNGFLSLDPGRHIHLPLRSHPPAGSHRLKVFATLDPVRWGDFELPPGRLPSPPRHRPKNAVEAELFAALFPGRRDSTRSQSSDGQWTVCDVLLRISAAE